MPESKKQPDIAWKWAIRRRLAYAGLWLVIAAIVCTLLVHQLDSRFSGLWVWVLLIVPAVGYLLLLWGICRCPVCGAPLVVDAGPYQRIVFNFAQRVCPRCGASLV